MRYRLHTVKDVDASEWAEQNGLEMEVTERDPKYLVDLDTRYSAKFSYAEVKRGSVLVGEYGHGKTPASAIADYIGRIAGQTLVIMARTKDRRELMVPSKIKLRKTPKRV